jgi:hypothetical protein
MTNLRQIIRESIQEYIREIDEAGDIAALEAKITKTQEAIDKRKKLSSKDGLDEEYHAFLDERKMKEMTSEIKHLEKSLGKYNKILDKLKSKASWNDQERGLTWNSQQIDVDGELEEMTTDPAEETSTQLEDKEAMNEEQVLYMQKMAGIISETEYKAKLEEAKKKASAGLTKKEKSAISKKAHAGKDIGKKGKGFEKVAKAGEKQYGSKEAGEKVAAAAMWKNAAKKAKSLKEEVQALFEFEVGDTIAVTVPQDFSIKDNSGTIKAVYANYSAIPKNWKEYGPDPDAYEEEELNSPWYLVMQSNGQEEVFSKSDIK